MLDVQGDRAAEVLGVIVADKGGYAIWHQDGGDFPQQIPRGLLAGEYQADERAGVARLSWRVSGR